MNQMDLSAQISGADKRHAAKASSIIVSPFSESHLELSKINAATSLCPKSVRNTTHSSFITASVSDNLQLRLNCVETVSPEREKKVKDTGGREIR